MSDKMIRDILKLFNDTYEAMYNAGESGTEEDIENYELITRLFPGILDQFVKLRKDYISSDRECAAYSRVVRSYIKNLAAVI
jgi:hypothetical protein